MSWLDKGDLFLPDLSRTELKKLYKCEKNVKGKLRLLAAIQRKKGKTLDEISVLLQKPKTTIHDWLKRLEKSGIEKLYDKKQSGRPKQLNKKQLSDLKNHLSESPQKQDLPFVIWTTKLVAYFIKIKYAIEYSVWQIRRIVKKLGFTFQKPRPEHYKANKKLQEDFKKNSKMKLDYMLKMDGRSYVLMNA